MKILFTPTLRRIEPHPVMYSGLPCDVLKPGVRGVEGGNGTVCPPLKMVKKSKNNLRKKPSLLLRGDSPRLIDEWQMAPVLKNHRRVSSSHPDRPGTTVYNYR
jgi:hypothetical protein